MNKKRGIGSAHRKRVARQGWWLSSAIPVREGGARAPSGLGRGVRGVCSGGRSWERKGKGGLRWRRARFIGSVVGSGEWAAGGEAWGAWGQRGGQVARCGRSSPTAAHARAARD
jgi:hypothetical protein